MSCISSTYEAGEEVYNCTVSTIDAISANYDGWKLAWDRALLIKAVAKFILQPDTTHLLFLSLCQVFFSSNFDSRLQGLISPPFLIQFFRYFLHFPRYRLACGCVVWEPSWPPGAGGGWAPYGPRLHHTTPPMHGLLSYAMLCYALLCLCTGGSACIYRSIGRSWRNGAPQLLILCPKWEPTNSVTI